MSETREPRPKDVHGNEIVMGAWYWSRNRKRQVIGTGKFACAIGGGDVTWFINGIGYSPEGFEFVPVDSPSFDLINVPEPAEVVDDHDDLRERVSKIEDRLAAIEHRLSTLDGSATVNTNAADGEASAVSEWPRYVQINENRIARFDDATSPSKNFDLVPIIGCTWDSQTPDEYIGRGQWKLISRAEAEARIAAARGEKPIEQQHAAATSGVSAEWQAATPDAPPFHVGQVVECVDVMPGWSLVKVGEKHKIEGVKPIGIKFSHSGYWYNPNCFRAIPPTAERESEPTPGGTKNLVDLIRKRLANEPELAYAAETNRYVCEMEQQLESMRAERDRAFEAMEAIKSGKVRRVYKSDAGRFRAVNCNVRGYYADNPTDAILAARDAAEGKG